MNTLPISHINSLLSFIHNQSGATLAELSEKMAIPANLLERNLEMLSSNPELYVYDLANDDTDSWCIDNLSKHDFVVSLNKWEQFLFHLVTKNRAFNPEIIYKTRYGITDYKTILNSLCRAVEEHRKVQTVYRTQDGQTLEFELEPLKVIFNEFENLIYAAGQRYGEIQFYRIDRFDLVHILTESFEPRLKTTLDNVLPYIWGMDYGEICDVKVRFFKEANVEGKIRRDLAGRIYGKLTEDGNTLLYEDRVIGLKAFKSWLRSYGSSAVVIEPQSLREEIIKEARQSRAYYNDLNVPDN